MQNNLLTIAAILECMAGLAFLLAPGACFSLLLGAQLDASGVLIGRIAGVALFALGIACGGARPDAGGAARSGTLKAITLYNAGVGLVLVVSGATGTAGGMVLWVAGAMHLGLAVAFLASLNGKNRRYSQ